MTKQTESYQQLHDTQIEKQVLGTLMYYPKDWEQIITTLDLLQPEDFYDLKHQDIYRAIKTCVMKDIAPEMLMVLDELKTGKYEYFKKDEVNVSEIVDLALITSYQLEKYSQIVKRYSILRKATATMLSSTTEVEKESDPIEFLAGIEAKILNVMSQVVEVRPANVLGIIDEVDKEVKENEELGKVGFTTGFSMLDRKLGALQPTHVWIVGAYTGHGKSHFINQIVLNCLEENEDASICLFSTEMDRKDIMLRLIANLSKMAALKVKKGMLTKEEQEAKVAAYERIKKYEGRLTIYDNCYSVEEIRLKAKKEKLHSKMNIMIVDFVQNVRAKGDIYERMSNVALAFQELAKELKCAIILASQISQEGQRMGADSGVISYKGAGEIAAIADVALWIVNADDNPDQTAVVKKVVKIKKARHAPTGWEMPINFDGMNGGAMWQDDSALLPEPKTNTVIDKAAEVAAPSTEPLPYWMEDK